MRIVIGRILSLVIRDFAWDAEIKYTLRGITQVVFSPRTSTVRGQNTVNIHIFALLNVRPALV